MANPRLNFTYDEWMSQTSKAFFMRSAQLKALDILVDSYIKTPSDNNLRYLKQGFSNWKASKGAGDAWFKSKRNDKSYYAITNLNAQLDGTGDTDAAFGVKDSAQTKEMVSARLGLLYLFGRTTCAREACSLTTSGVLDLLAGGMSLGGDLSEAAKPVLEKVKVGVSTARTAFIDDAAKAIDASRSQNDPRLTPGKPVYSTRKEKIETIDSRLVFNPPKASLNPDERKVSDALMEGLKKTTEKAIGAWDEHGGTVLRQLSDFLVKKYLGSAVNDILGGSLAIVPSLLKTISGSYQRYDAWLLTHRSPLQPGAPTAIVDGLKRAMDLGIANNLYATLKSGAQLGMTISSAGGAAIVNVVASVVEVLVRSAWRLVELRLFDQFLNEAHTKWEARGAVPIHERPIEFNRWFRRHVERVPLIAALSINSGFCHNMTFLQMFDSADEVMKPPQYKVAVAGFNRLKGFAAAYIKDTGYELLSNDEFVIASLKPSYQSEGAIKKHVLEPLLAACG